MEAEAVRDWKQTNGVGSEWCEAEAESRKADQTNSVRTWKPRHRKEPAPMKQSIVENTLILIAAGIFGLTVGLTLIG